VLLENGAPDQLNMTAKQGNTVLQAQLEVKSAMRVLTMMEP
jgi:hypothetical protein